MDYAKAMEMYPLASNTVLEQLRAKGKLPLAEKLFRQSLAGFQKRVADSPADAEFRTAVAIIGIHLGHVLRETGRLEEAAKVYREAGAILEKLVLDVPDKAEKRLELGNVYISLIHSTTKPEGKEDCRARRDGTLGTIHC